MNKYLYSILFTWLSLFLDISCIYSQSQEKDWQIALGKADLVCIGTVSEIVDIYKNETTVILQIEKRWKSDFPIYPSLQVKLKLINTSLQEGQTYLLFATKIKNLDSYAYPEYLLQENNIIKLAFLAQQEIAHLNLLVTCRDKNRINLEGKCERINAPVCGCDNITYGNVCEAEKKGITVWTKGKCK